MFWRLSLLVVVLTALSSCGPSYSPDTYSANAAQQANKVEQGVVVGVRDVGISAAGTVGTVTGAAAGGIAGSQAASGPVAAITALGGSLVGGIAGSAVEHTTADTAAFEYIVRKANGDLVSVTQKDKTPLALGQKVLVIAGTQARVVPDYTVPPEPGAAVASKSGKPETTAPIPADAKSVAPAKTETPSASEVPTANKEASPVDTKPGAPAATPAPAPDAKPIDAKPGDTKPADAKPAGTPDHPS